MARYIHAYFNRREPSDWKLEEFMRECDLSSAAKKSDAWIKSLRALSGQAGPVRDQATVLLRQYKSASVDTFLLLVSERS